MIAENVGGTWRKLGRELCLSETKLKSISLRFPTDLEETVRELLKEWRESRGAEARTGELIKALRACQQNLTADIVEAACLHLMSTETCLQDGNITIQAVVNHQ